MNCKPSNGACNKRKYKQVNNFTMPSFIAIIDTKVTMNRVLARPTINGPFSVNCIL